MEIVDMTDESHKRHKWLEWIRLEQPPPRPESWVPVVRALPLTNPAKGTSNLGDQLVELLGKATIEAYQRSYLWDGTWVDTTGRSGGRIETHVAVLVQARDRERAIAVATDLQRSMDEAFQVSDEELTRQALEAGERLKAEVQAAKATSQDDAQREDRIA